MRLTVAEGTAAATRFVGGFGTGEKAKSEKSESETSASEAFILLAFNSAPMLSALLGIPEEKARRSIGVLTGAILPVFCFCLS